jgi:Rrf2 family iron-sulfur cluster assembly transcriptional regulator
VLRLRSKTAFAVTAMVEIAMNHPHGPVPLSKICARHNISITSLEEIFSKLLGHQLVKSTRGPGGGYSLRLKADEINLADIALAVDESMGQDDSLISGTMRSDICAQFNMQVVQQLRAISLSKLVSEQHEQHERLSLAPAQRNKGACHV